MGYMKIPNLYKDQRLLNFKSLFALEKIHGTSAHVRWDGNELRFFSGGEPHEKFVAIFDRERLAERCRAFCTGPVTFYGEAYGGKQQGMRETYGPDLKFVVFDVSTGSEVEERRIWLSVPDAEKLARDVGFEFVYYEHGPATLEWVDAQRDAPSQQAIRNGITELRIREGVVLRPPFEVRLNNGERLIAKHKRPEFSETATTRTVKEPTAAQLDAEGVAKEWVTPERMRHVLSALTVDGVAPEFPKDLGRVLPAMVEDIRVEGAGEVDMTPEARRAISGQAKRVWEELLRSALS